MPAMTKILLIQTQTVYNGDMKIANISPIITKLPFGKTQLFSYLIPEEIENEIQVGMIVEIPLGTRIVQGVVFDITYPLLTSPSVKGRNLRSIKKIILGIQLNQYQLDLAMWMHKFYHAPLGIVLKFVIPKRPKKVQSSNEKVQRNNKKQKYKIKNDAGIQFLISSSQDERFEQYINLIKKHKKQKKQVLILVSKIIDVETLYLRFVETLQCNVSTDVNIGKLHSQLSMGEYYKNWAGFQLGEIDVIIGTRQAILSPPSDLGLIIVNEYQDDDFNQADQTPRFSAVEVAKKILEIMGVELILTSSAPIVGMCDVETQNFASLRSGNTTIIDSQNEFYGKNFSPLSNKLRDELERNEGWALLLVNRRGEAAFIICKDCGNVIKCPKCDTPLVLHKEIKYNRITEFLICHKCLYKIAPPEKCSKCSSSKIKYASPGTQGIEKEIINSKTLIVQNIVRIDSDTLKTKKEMSSILKKMQKNSGVIIGTQVAIKNWLPRKLNLIGIINIDNFLNRPDFRASEKTFQVIRELTSRLDKNGKMIIQTFNPESKLLSLAMAGDYKVFAKEELTVRKQFSYPPFVKIIHFSLAGRDVRNVLQEVGRMQKMILPEFKNIEVLGPMPMRNVRKGLFGKTLTLKISHWNEKIHLKLMEKISDSWMVETV